MNLDPRRPAPQTCCVSLDEQWAFWRLPDLPPGVYGRSRVCHIALRKMQASQVRLVCPFLVVE
jgi:hypothetical protein